jgi:hypothetical protein
VTDDIELVRNFVKDSEFSDEIKEALLRALMLEKLNKPETDFDRLVKEISERRTNED